DTKYGSIFNFGNLTLINSTFENNIGFCGNDITNVNILKVENCKFTTKNGTWGSIYIEMGKVDIKNSNFTDIESKYSSGIDYRAISNNSSLSILNCIFENTTSSVTAGAIGLKNTVNVLIKDTVFKNTKSAKNAGTIFADNVGNLIIENCSFINGSSDFGGALVLLSTNVKIVNSTFANNSANYNGGGIYTSWTNMTIVNSSFNSNKGTVDSNGGAIYSDYSNFKIKNSNFINNQVTEYGSGICLHQSNMTLTNSEFRENKGKNKSLIYSVFSGNITLNNNTYDGGSISLNNTFYINDIPDEASKITLVNNTIIVENLPSKFDLRDYGWVGPIENQGFMGACWAFTTLGSLESALLKATGIQYNLSENNLQDLMIKYSNMGFIYSEEEGAPIIALTYLVSWIGPVDEDEDKYDELGKISPVLDSNIHIQNAVLVKPYGKTMDIDLIKRSLIEYGAVTYTLFWDYAYFNLNTSAYYDNSTEKVNHDVIIVGWDDNYSKDNFNIAPPGDGAFIMKNSMGEEWGDKGYFYLSYYSNIGGNYEFAFKITNETYNINYQHGLGGYVDLDKFPYYASEFTSIGNDLIAAFGTFFNQTTNYKVKLYINNILEYEQEGENEFAGYNTIHLNEKIPVKKGDIIRIEVKQLNTPVTNNSREVLEENVAFISEDGKNWIDASKNQSQGIPLIKVYTEATNLMTEN
ncbi:MAG: hypothetical protein HUK28_05340, partial [Methanobrevibacter sp.]|nr:hypothetical protein [Methanobrevibacter sp.]